MLEVRDILFLCLPMLNVWASPPLQVGSCSLYTVFTLMILGRGYPIEQLALKSSHLETGAKLSSLYTHSYAALQHTY